MGASVHPTAVVDGAAKLGEGVEIGPFCVVGPEVELGDGVRLASHVVVEGRTSIGQNTRVFSFACLGNPPQHLKYGGEPSRLVIGRNNTIREYVTMNPGTAGGRMQTTVGDGGYFMAASHVAHDCIVGNSVVMANNATIGGHVEVGDHVILGGLCAVQQFVRIGEHAFIGGMSGVTQDVIPYGIARGYPGYLAGLNLVGLKRRGFDRSHISALRSAYRRIFAEDRHLKDRLDAVEAEHGDQPSIRRLLQFMRAESHHHIMQPRGPDEGDDDPR